MLILKGLGEDDIQEGRGVSSYVPIYDTDMSITGSSSSSIVSKEILTNLNATSSFKTPRLRTETEVLKSNLSFVSLIPTIRAAGSTDSGEESLVSCLYTGTAERTVGGINEADTFVEATMTEMWDALIRQEKFPALTSPSSSFTASTTGFREVGEVISSIRFTTNFNRGSITPQYNADSPYRSGLPNRYNYTGTNLSTIIDTDQVTNTQSIYNYVVQVNSQVWTNNVSYDGGVQPKSSYNNDYGSPLPAGTTSTDIQIITGVLPVFGTTSNILTLSKRPLQSNGSMIQIDFVAEEGDDKQIVEFPDDPMLSWGNIVKVEFYDTAASAWKIINGSASDSLNTFTVSETQHTIQGATITYKRYTHNGPTTGSRQTRWYVA
jgi:hypothetical protein